MPFARRAAAVRSPAPHQPALPLDAPARTVRAPAGVRWLVRVVARLHGAGAPHRLVLRLERLTPTRPRAHTVVVEAPHLDALDDTILRAMVA